MKKITMKIKKLTEQRFQLISLTIYSHIQTYTRTQKQIKKK